MARIRLVDVKKDFGAVPALRGINLTVEHGELLAILGPSGCGKSTTMQLLAGFLDPDAGEIWADDRLLSSPRGIVPPERRRMSLVFQSYAVWPHMTVFENIAFGLQMRKLPEWEINERVQRMLDIVNLGGFERRYPHELSGGQQQRVALARALVVEPDALLLDEPLSALDRKLRESLQSEIKEIQKRFGISILFVTHDQDEAMMMSDRIAVMAEGRIVQVGSPSDVYLHPATPFVAGFLGETNLVPGTYRGTDDGYAVVAFKDAALGRARLPADGRNLTAGEAVLVSVRPERVRLLTHPAEPNFAGSVTDCTFLGRHTRYRIQALGQALAVSVTEWSPAAALSSGTPVRLSWAAEDAQILSEPEGALATPLEIIR